MKYKLLHTILIVSKFTLYGFLILGISISTLLANPSEAQVKSIYEVHVNLDVKGSPLNQVFEAIEKQTNFTFVYGELELDNLLRVNISGENISVGNVLFDMSKQANLKFYQLNNNISVSKHSSRNRSIKKSEIKVVIDQFKIISGKVTDENGEPLPGVNIVVKETSAGTVTDVNGDYKIDVPSTENILVFSSIGYIREEIVIGNRTIVDVTMMPDIQSLSEIVVTALGIKREERTLGYAFSDVDGEELIQAKTVNPVSALQGKVAGVQINTTSGGTFGGSRITIRGNATFGGNTQPIFVVDGIVMDNETSGVDGTDWGNQLKNLNPDDFESVSVLKGAAATALYGSRALHGVVMITTKSGIKRKGLGVSVNQTSGVRYVYDEPDFQNQYGYGPTAGMFSNDVTNGRPDGDKHDNQQFAFYELINGQNVPSLQHNNSEENAASWGPKFAGQDYIDYDGSMAKWEAQPDNYRDMFETGIVNNTNLAIDGGGEKNTFRLSYSNFSETGVMPNNDFKKNSFSLKGTQELVENVIKVGANIQYTKSTANNPPPGALTSAWFHDGFPRSYDPNKWRNNYKAVDGGVPYPTGSDKYMYTRKSKTWFEIFERDIEREEGSLLASVNVDINIAKGISAKIDGNINQFTYINESKTDATSLDRLSNAKYTLAHGEKFQSNFSGSFIFEKELNKDLNFDLLVGASTWSTDASSSSASTNRGFKVRQFYNIDNSFDSPTFDGGIGERKTINSVYSYFNVGYKSTLFLSLTGRNDWSSALVYPDGSGNNSYFYPSASLAWVVNETIKLPEFISFAKVRASFAQVGNDTGPYLLSHGYVTQNFNEEPNLALYKLKNTTAVSPDLKPERKRSFETGFDLRFLDGRVRMDFAYYKDNTRDQILELTVPSESGITNQLINAGNLQNQGIELAISGSPIETRDFSWDIGVNFTHNRDKIISLYPGVTEKILFGNPDDSNAGTATFAFVGGEYGQLATRQGYKFYQAMDANGNPTEHRNNGMPVFSQRNNWSVTYLNGRQNKDSLLRMGNMQPDWYGAVNTGFRYKGLRLTALVDMSFGGDVYSSAYRYGLHQGVIESSLPNRDASQGGITWTSQGFGNNIFGKTYQDGYIPEGVFPDNTTVRFVDDNGVTTTHDVGGMTYQEAYDQGLVEPTHWSGHIYRWTSASTGTPQMAIFESNWIALRELTISYDLPGQWLSKTFLQQANISLTGRDLGFLYNSMPDNINPAISNNAAGNALQMGFAPYIRSFTLALRANF